MSNKSNVAIALAALAAGAAIGILFAPAARAANAIATKGSDLRDSLNDMLAEGGELIEKLKGEAGDLVSKGKDAANTMKDRVKDTAQEAAGAARSGANGGYKG